MSRGSFRARVCFISLFFSCLLCQSYLYAKSVFAVSSHASGKVKAYHIDPNGAVTFQATIANTENFGNGATGLCVWPEWEKIFVCYEGSNKIAWASCKTLIRQSDDEYDAPEVNLAGMTVDTTRQVMYVISRQNGHLYAFQYDPIDDTLILDYPANSPDQSYRQLAGLEYSACFGIAFQTGSLMGGDYLYVADGTSIVRRYNTQTWQLAGQLDMKKEIIGLDVDEQRGILYGGGHWTNNFLVRYDLDGDPNQPATCTSVNLGFGVTDVKIDEASGLLYMLTRRGDFGGQGTLEVYDPTLWTTDPNDLIHKDTEYDNDYTGEGPGGLGIGPTYKYPRMHISKQDDKTACVSPQKLITYSMAFHPDRQNETNVVITDKLPAGVEFESASPPNTGTYHERPEHCYVWELGDVAGYDPNTSGDPNYYFSLTAQVNNLAEPAGSLVNTVEAESDEALATAKETTPVCCWDSGDVIYVDRNATGAGIGTNWENAYTTLQKAIDRKNKNCGGDQIWVARGTYKPGTQPTSTFLIPEDVAMYGGFASWETSIDQRHIKDNPTILSGDTGILDNGVLRRNISIVTMSNNSLLDGVIVKDSGVSGYGVRGQSVNFTIENCIVEENQQYGIYADNGNASVKWCIVKNNGVDGIRHQGNNIKAIVIENCQILENGQNGIDAQFSIPTIRNNMIVRNGSAGSGYYGLYLSYPQTGYAVRNNTVVYNANEGIRAVDPNNPIDIRNCILYGNKDSSDEQLKGNIVARYSCVWDPNNIHITPDTTYHNISCDPRFAYDGDPNVVIYHLLPDSYCIDKGDPGLSYADQNDIDTETRLMGNYVDIGADEIDPDCSDVYNANDWNADGLVNFYEFNFFSRAWLSHWGDLAWNSKCDLNNDHQIDLADLMVFIEDWAWKACWKHIQQFQQPPAEPTPPASPPAEPNAPPVEPPAEPPAEPNVVFKIQDANELGEITLITGQSICLYLAKQTFEEDVFGICLEVVISDPNFGWLDNTEYNPNDPNNSGTAQILASPRTAFFDYYGPGDTQFEGIQFTAASLGEAIQDGSLASFVYTATQPGDVLLTLVNYDTTPATLEQIVIHQIDAESYSSSYSSQMKISGLNGLVGIDSTAETENILSLLEDINVFIDTGGEDAATWQEVKNLLEQSLIESEDTANDPNEF